MGSGELEDDLRARADDRVVWAGFVNQSQLADYYLAADVLVLPSRRMGETWGLVVNEALQAGCGVIISNAVGSHREFGQWERVRVVPENDAEAIAGAMSELGELPREFDWAREQLARYSLEEATEAFVEQIHHLKGSHVH